MYVCPADFSSFHDPAEGSWCAQRIANGEWFRTWFIDDVLAGSFSAPAAVTANNGVLIGHMRVVSADGNFVSAKAKSQLVIKFSKSQLTYQFGPISL